MPTFDSTCRIRRHAFQYECSAAEAASEPTPDVCGMQWCQAKAFWTIDRWAGQIRMADARTAAGIPESDLDAEARRQALDVSR